MGWMAIWAAIALAGLIGLVASANSYRFERWVHAEARELMAAANTPRPIDPARLQHLPAPAQRYLKKALGGRTRAIQTARLRHGGVFRTSLDGSWLPIRGEQYFTSDPPGFVWHGRVRLAPGLWIDARDRSIGGAGNMFISVESTYTIGNSSGPELDQGALLRLLGELAWLPTAYLDERYVQWSPVDDRQAGVTLQVGARTVSGTFEFGADDLPAGFTAERYRDLGGGRSALTQFVGHSSDYREIGGVLVPYRVVGAWIVENAEAEYADFRVEQIEFDSNGPS